MSEIITINYRNDCDLIKINKKIEMILQSESGSVNQLKNEINLCRQKIQMTNMINQKFALLDKINSLEDKIKVIDDNRKLLAYQEEVKDILTVYKSLSIKKTTFGVKSQEDNLSPEREAVFTQFFKIISKYVEIEIYRNFVNDGKCSNCQVDINDLTEPCHGEILECPGCGFNLLPLKDTSDGVEVGDYKDRENFEKTIINYQGKEKINFPKHLFEALDKYYKSFNLPTGEEIRAKKVNDLGYASLRMALQKTGYSIYYDHIWLLANIYWNKPLADIRHLHDILMRDYDLTEKVFKKIKGNSRKASINTKWRLVKQLRMRGHSISKDDFRTVETPESLEYYETMWKQMCEGSGDPEIKYHKSF